jgi:hypothetical protein
LLRERNRSPTIPGHARGRHTRERRSHASSRRRGVTTTIPRNPVLVTNAPLRKPRPRTRARQTLSVHGKGMEESRIAVRSAATQADGRKPAEDPKPASIKAPPGGGTPANVGVTEVQAVGTPVTLHTSAPRCTDRRLCRYSSYVMTGSSVTAEALPPSWPPLRNEPRHDGVGQQEMYMWLSAHRQR